MPSAPRRVVTGHNDRGVSVFASDGPVPVARMSPSGTLFCEIWSTQEMPTPIAAAEPDPTLTAAAVPNVAPPPVGGASPDGVHPHRRRVHPGPA